MDHVLLHSGRERVAVGQVPAMQKEQGDARTTLTTTLFAPGASGMTPRPILLHSLTRPTLYHKIQRIFDTNWTVLDLALPALSGASVAAALVLQK